MRHEGADREIRRDYVLASNRLTRVWRMKPAELFVGTVWGRMTRLSRWSAQRPPSLWCSSDDRRPGSCPASRRRGLSVACFGPSMGAQEVGTRWSPHLLAEALAAVQRRSHFRTAVTDVEDAARSLRSNATGSRCLAAFFPTTKRKPTPRHLGEPGLVALFRSSASSHLPSRAVRVCVLRRRPTCYSLLNTYKDSLEFFTPSRDEGRRGAA